jgi:hypothetical protein
MTRIILENSACICGHLEDFHNKNDGCAIGWVRTNTGETKLAVLRNRHCDCKKYTPDPKNKVVLSVTISAVLAHKFKNYVTLMHGFKKGGLSFELERAIRQFMGEENIDVFIDDKEWQEYNK